LVGVVIHRGNADYGHYTSIIDVDRNDPNTERDKVEGSLWLYFDDSIVSTFDLKNFEDECFGKPMDMNQFRCFNIEMQISSSKSAYMLVYEKVKMKKIQFELRENKGEEDLKLIKSFLR